MTQGSALLFRHLRDRHDLTALTVDPEPPTPFPDADPYLLSSAMQKTVRRGDTAIARRAGHQLLRLDRQRLWRRLAVIGLEDIGIGDVEVAAELVAIATMPAAHRLLGGDIPALDIALVRACAAAKDRTADHLASIISREPVDNMDRAAIRTASPNALLAMIASSDLPWTRRLRAAVIASGRSEPVQPGARIAAVFDVLHELGVPELLLAACAVYAARQRDLLPIFVPFVWMLHATGLSDEARRAKAECTNIVAHDLPPSEQIGDWPSYVFDPLWTRTGKRAVRLWLKAYLTIPAFNERQVAAALWNAESAACDRTLSWPLGEVIRERAYAADLSHRGLPLDRHAELNAWIVRERPALIAARVAIWNSVRREFAKPAEVNSQPNPPLQVPSRPPEPDLFGVARITKPQGRRRMFKNLPDNHDV